MDFNQQPSIECAVTLNSSFPVITFVTRPIFSQLIDNGFKRGCHIFVWGGGILDEILGQLVLYCIPVSISRLEILLNACLNCMQASLKISINLYIAVCKMLSNTKLLQK